MSERPPSARERLSPNQLDKQRQIVEAAMAVLARRGLAACTVREIAAAGPLTKSAIHYYFADLDVLVDQAMAAHVGNFEAGLRSAAGSGDPRAGFWAVIDAYLATFRDQPQIGPLWLEYTADALRTGRGDAVAELNDRITALLAGLLRAAGVGEPQDTAWAVFLGLAGTLLDPRPAAAALAREHIAVLTGLGVQNEAPSSPGTAAAPG